MKFNKTEAIIFDLGRVLVNVDIHRGIFELLSRSFGDTPETAITQMMQEPSYAAYNAGTLTPKEFYESMKKKFSLDVDFHAFAKLWCDVFDPMTDMEGLIRQLHGKVRLGILSDTDPMHWNYIRSRYEFLSLIKKPTLSFQTGYRKPDTRAFLAAADSVSTSPQNCLYIDDLSINVAAAAQVGMDAIQFLSVLQLKQELKSRSIHCE